MNKDGTVFLLFIVLFLLTVMIIDKINEWRIKAHKYDEIQNEKLKDKVLTKKEEELLKEKRGVNDVLSDIGFYLTVFSVIVYKTFLIRKRECKESLKRIKNKLFMRR